MPVREIAASFEFVCDGCGKVKAKKNNSRPCYWTHLHIQRDAYDFQGAAVADASVKRLLCDKCSPLVFDAINAALTKVQQP